MTQTDFDTFGWGMFLVIRPTSDKARSIIETLNLPDSVVFAMGKYTFPCFGTNDELHREKWAECYNALTSAKCRPNIITA